MSIVGFMASHTVNVLKGRNATSNIIIQLRTKMIRQTPSNGLIFSFSVIYFRLFSVK